jgi:ankyrin repeat protein
VGHAGIASFLIESGADVNATNDYGWTPLHYAAAPEDESVALLLMQNGADVNAVNTDGNTPLHFAAEYGKLQMTRQMLSQTARMSANNGGATPLDLAVDSEWEPMISLLKDLSS